MDWWINNPFKKPPTSEHMENLVKRLLFQIQRKKHVSRILWVCGKLDKNQTWLHQLWLSSLTSIVGLIKWKIFFLSFENWQKLLELNLAVSSMCCTKTYRTKHTSRLLKSGQMKKLCSYTFKQNTLNKLPNRSKQLLPNQSKLLNIKNFFDCISITIWNRTLSIVSYAFNWICLFCIHL